MPKITTLCRPISVLIRVTSILFSVTFNTCGYANDTPDLPLLDGVDDKNNHHPLPARYALVVGIDRYTAARKVILNDLPSAVKDAVDVARALKDKASFDVTLLTPDQDPGKYNPIRRSEILSAIAALAARARDSKQSTQRNPVILVYFAGHGLSDGNDDYILPADFNPTFANDVSDMSISVTQILSRLQYANPSLRIIITDACRNAAPVSLVFLDQKNVTFAPGGSAAGSHKAISNAEDGSELIYSTLKGSTATGDGENGRFTGEFVGVMNSVFSQIKTSGAEIHSNGSKLSELYHSTYSLMDARTDSRQIPEEIGAGPEFDFSPTAANFSLEKDLWNSAQRITNITGEITDLAFERRRYCLMRQFVGTTSVTSFYGEDALKKLRNLEKTLTDDEGVNTQISVLGRGKSPGCC